MSAAGTGSRPVVSPAVAAGLVIVSMLSLVAYLALSAYAPDLRNDTDGGAHALSKSAVGFEGLRILLDAADIPNTIGRGYSSRPTQPPGLFVLTPPADSQDKDAINRL